MTVPLHVAVSGWLLGPMSGANRRLLALLAAVDELLQEGERVTVLHRPDFAPPTGTGAVRWQPIAIPPAPSHTRVRHERRLLATALQQLGATVHDHGFLPLLPRPPLPTCLLIHDVRDADGHSRRPRWFGRMVLRRAARTADAVVVPSEFTRQRVLALVPDSAPIEVVPNAAWTPPATAATVPLPRPVPKHGFVLHVGHVEPRKNLTVLVDALAAMPPATRPELWLAGADGGALAKLRARAQSRGVASGVHAFGPSDDVTLDALYAAARCVAVPSRYEGFGLPALEALVRGRPLLAARAGALPEVVGDQATLLPPDDAEAWCSALMTAWPDDDAARSARRRAAARFSWQASAKQLLAIWRRLHHS